MCQGHEWDLRGWGLCREGPPPNATESRDAQCQIQVETRLPQGTRLLSP